MFCTNCGKQNQENTKFCIHCGAIMIQSEADATASSTLEPEQTRAEWQPNTPPPMQQSVPAHPPMYTRYDAPKTSSKTPLIVTLLILLIAIVAGIVAWRLHQNHSTQTTPSTTATVQAQANTAASAGNATEQADTSSNSNTQSAAAKANLDDYVGSWKVDKYSSYSDGYIGFDIKKQGGKYLFSANAVYNQGNQTVSIGGGVADESPDVELEMNYDGTRAGGPYTDTWNNNGSVFLDFKDGQMYLTITVDGDSGRYSMKVEHEHCSRAAATDDTAQAQASNQTSDYVFPSDTQYLTTANLQGQTQATIRLIRNEIYARHGYVFKSQDLQTYFSSKAWYTPNPNFSESMLNAVEKANITTISTYEKAMGWK